MGADDIIASLRRRSGRLKTRSGTRRDRESDTAYHRHWRAANRDAYNEYQRRRRRLVKLRRTPH